MAKEVFTRLIDDITKEPVPEGQGESVQFSIGGRDYELDLNDKNAKKFNETMQFYVDHATELDQSAPSPARGRRPASTAATKSTKRDPAQLQKIREWANANGYTVAPRGRIKSEIEEAYNNRAAKG